MSAAVDQVIARILESEGGIDDVGDGKGVTRFGQTPQWLDDHGFVPPSTVADAAANYEVWMTVRTPLAAICEIDPVVGYLVTDFAVHAGLTVAVRAMQRVLGVPADGVYGPQTAARLAETAGMPRLARRVLAAEMRFKGRLLGAKVPDRRPWAAGWLNRLADKLEQLP